MNWLSRFTRLTACSFGAVMALFTALASPAAAWDPESWLPAEPAPEWTRVLATPALNGDELFGYIDGGAEIYVRNGYETGALSAYAGPGGRELGAEIYVMRDAPSARTVFDTQAEGVGEPTALGDAARLADDHVRLLVGRVLVVVTIDDGQPDPDNLRTTLAGMILERIKQLPLP